MSSGVRKCRTVYIRGGGDRTCQGGLLAPREGGRAEGRGCTERAQGSGGSPYTPNAADQDR